MSVDVDKGGPLFDGRAEKAMRDACDDIEKVVAGIGAGMVQSQLARVLKTQTPYYRTQVVARPEAPGWKVTDQAVIYGYWLEGIGSRNAPVTRFKGYHTFRRVTAVLDGRAKMIATQVLVKYIGRMQ